MSIVLRESSGKTLLGKLLISFLSLVLVVLGFFFLTRTAPAITLFSTQEPITEVKKITQEVLADDPGAVVVEKNENSIKFKLSNGQYRLIINEGKFYTQDGLEIDTTLNNTATKWWEVWRWNQEDWLAQTGEGLDHAIKIGETGNRQFVPRKTHPDEYLELGSPEYYNGTVWLPIPLGEAQIKENRIFWEGDSYILEYVITPTGSKSNLILKDPSANHSLRWPISLHNLTQEDKDIFSNSDNTVVSVLQKPFWVDADHMVGGVGLEIQSGYVQFNPEITENVVYPITLDPTYSAYGGGTCVHTGSSNFNYGGPYLGGEGYMIWQAYANATIPKNSTISSATQTFSGSSYWNSPLSATIYGIKHEYNHIAPTDWSSWLTDHNSYHTSAYSSFGWYGENGGGTASFANVIQELVNQSGWVSGYTLGVHFDGSGGGWMLWSSIGPLSVTYTAPTPPGVTITESGGSTAVTEGGATDTYTVVLNVVPTGNVTITLSNPADATGAPTPLTFTTGDWSTPKTVTVTAVNDTEVEGTETATITHSASGGGYDGVSIASVSVTVTDNDVPTPPDPDPSGAWYDCDWNTRKTIVIDNTKVSGSQDLTNFPVLISVTDANLKTVANGGGVAQSNGGDILFTSINGTTKLDHEIEYYADNKGELIAWVEIPTLDYDNDTKIYLYYGNDAGSLNEQNVTGTWNSNYKNVWHLDEASGNFSDSTATNNTGTDYVSATGKTGKIGSGQEFDGSDDYIEVSYSSVRDFGTSNFTISTWLNIPDQANRPIVEWGTYSNNGFIIRTNESGTSKISVYISGVLYQWDYAFSASTWYHLVVARTNATTLQAFVNGNSLGTITIPSGGTVTANGGVTKIGQVTSGAVGGGPWKGYFDEFRISNTNRSADWIATEFANQNSPQTFFGISAEAPSTCGGRIILITENIFDKATKLFSSIFPFALAKNQYI